MFKRDFYLDVDRRDVNRMVCLLSVLFLFLAGCSGLSSRNPAETVPEEAGQAEKGPIPLYYDFGDVLVPLELKLDRKSSFVYQTSGFSAGVLVLSGRVEVTSLIAFFENNMTKDNWKIVSSFKSRRTVMLFHKESRWCVINITEENFTTRVEIWVAPTVNEVETGLLK